MTVQAKHINRMAPLLFAVAALFWFLAAWLSEEIAFYGVGAMFLILGLGAFTRARKGRPS